MKMFRPFSHLKSALDVQAARWLKNRDGVAAIEFAFVVPILLILYFVTLEAGVAIETKKKVSRIASMMGDLATQEQETTATELAAIFKISESIIKPYNQTKPTMQIEGIQILDEAQKRAKVMWRLNYSPQGVITVDRTPTQQDVFSNDVPSKLLIRDTFLVRSYVNLLYQPVIAWNNSKAKERTFYSPFQPNMAMTDTYYFGSRMSSDVKCDGCDKALPPGTP